MWLTCEFSKCITTSKKICYMQTELVLRLFRRWFSGGFYKCSNVFRNFQLISHITGEAAWNHRLHIAYHLYPASPWSHNIGINPSFHFNQFFLYQIVFGPTECLMYSYWACGARPVSIGKHSILLSLHWYFVKTFLICFVLTSCSQTNNCSFHRAPVSQIAFFLFFLVILSLGKKSLMWNLNTSLRSLK